MIEILDFLQEHIKAVIAVIVMIVCLGVGSIVSGQFAKQASDSANDLHTIENQISNVNDKLNNPEKRYKELEKGYKESRVERDTKILIGAGTGNGGTNEWLSRFLSWNTGDEYNENRNWFVEKLGASNVFCTTIMRDYDTNVSLGESKKDVIDPNKVTCILDIDKTEKAVYVNSIDDNTGIYEYVVFAYYNGKEAYANTAFKAMDRVQCYIITVSVDADGNVLPETFVVSAGPASTI